MGCAQYVQLGLWQDRLFAILLLDSATYTCTYTCWRNDLQNHNPIGHSLQILSAYLVQDTALVCIIGRAFYCSMHVLPEA